MIKFRKILYELRKPTFSYVKKLFPNVPEYVAYDFFYKSLKDNFESNEANEFIDEFKDYEWKLQKNFKITKNIFNKKTLDIFKERGKGDMQWYGVENDIKRHEMQRELINKKGIPKEPIIMKKDGSKYELLEGYHRTIQLLNLFPEGYIYPNVYIGEKND